MSLNQRLIAALEGLGLDVLPGVDAGHRDRCFTFNYDLLPCQFTGNRPIYYRALVQVHLFLPLGENGVALRRRTAEALSGAGFTWPESIDASDEDGQHIVFECEIIDTTKRDPPDAYASGGRGGARERSETCPPGRGEQSGLCDDERTE